MTATVGATDAIPLVDLRPQHDCVADEVGEGFSRVIERGGFILGEEVRAFEAAFARFSGVRHCIAVGNGTDAIELALRAAGVGPGDEVVVPTNSFIATALAVARSGATPVLVDVAEDTLLVDVEAVAARIGARMKAIVPVHLYGQMAPLGQLARLAGESGVHVVEDAAQAHGATQDGRGPGSVGLAAATSFYPGKNLGAYGDGGAVLTNDDAVARRVRALRNYGGEAKYEHPEVGFNSRLDSLQAVVLAAKLRHLDAWNAQRSAAARVYDGLLEDVADVRLPVTAPGNRHVWHLYVVRLPDPEKRDRVLRALNDAGIGAGLHYPVPIHLQGAFASLGHSPGDFPVAERAAGQILSLPLFPGITLEQQERVVAVLGASL